MPNVAKRHAMPPQATTAPTTPGIDASPDRFAAPAASSKMPSPMTAPIASASQ